ncbi:MAG: hypothetical protein HRU34_05600 [Richelia sp.]|nr:hypothetical protein [Richelia sp.]
MTGLQIGSYSIPGIATYPDYIEIEAINVNFDLLPALIGFITSEKKHLDQPDLG